MSLIDMTVSYFSPMVQQPASSTLLFFTPCDSGAAPVTPLIWWERKDIQNNRERCIRKAVECHQRSLRFWDKNRTPRTMLHRKTLHKVGSHLKQALRWMEKAKAFDIPEPPKEES